MSLVMDGHAQPQAASVDVDPVTYEVIRHRLTAIADQQSAVLKSVSGSPIVTDANDCNTGIYMSAGELLTVGPHVVFHAGSMSRVVPHIIADCDDTIGINEGDAFITNDPYKGALHIPDVTMLEPVFWEGERIAWVGACAHQLDMGGMTPSSWCPTADDYRQEGLILPPTKLVDRGVVREDVWRLILAASRLPFMVGLDLKAMLATNKQGRTGLLNLVSRYGVDTVRSVMATMLDRSEIQLRDRLGQLPDGEFHARNFLDHDGHRNNLYTIDLHLTKAGDRLTLDFSGSSPQAGGFVNATASGLFGAVFSGIAPVLAHDVSWNAGLLRPVDVIAPEGLIVNARQPAPCSSSPLGTTWLIEAVTVEAVSRLVAAHPEQSREAMATSTGSMGLMHFGGLNQYDEPFGNASTDAMMGGGGATLQRRGLDFSGPHNIFKYAVPNVENTERVTPILYLSHGSKIDSAGPGRLRGGSSGAASFVVHDVPAMGAVLVAHGVEVPNSLGLFAGHPGSCHDFSLVRDTNVAELWEAGKAVIGVDDVAGEPEHLSGKPGELLLRAGDVFQWTWQGGGGIGDPLAAAPSQVAMDVELEHVSPTAARELYGVVLDRGGQVDAEATEMLRHEMRRDRRNWPVAEGRSWSPSGDGRTLAQFGDSLSIVMYNDGSYWVCQCGRTLAPAAENWKLSMATRITRAEHRQTVTLHEQLEMREYACQSCGTLHGVEVARIGDPSTFECRLVLPPEGSSA